MVYSESVVFSSPFCQTVTEHISESGCKTQKDQQTAQHDRCTPHQHIMQHPTQLTPLAVRVTLLFPLFLNRWIIVPHPLTDILNFDACFDSKVRWGQ